MRKISDFPSLLGGSNISHILNSLQDLGARSSRNKFGMCEGGDS